jgi:hypothetical protein
MGYPQIHYGAHGKGGSILLIYAAGNGTGCRWAPWLFHGGKGVVIPPVIIDFTPGLHFKIVDFLCRQSGYLHIVGTTRDKLTPHIINGYRV